MCRVCHNLNQCGSERQRAPMLRKFDGTCLSQQLRPFAIGIGHVRPVGVLDDREARGAKCVGWKKRAGVGTVCTGMHGVGNS